VRTPRSFPGPKGAQPRSVLKLAVERHVFGKIRRTACSFFKRRNGGRHANERDSRVALVAGRQPSPSAWGRARIERHASAAPANTRVHLSRGVRSSPRT